MPRESLDGLSRRAWLRRASLLAAPALLSWPLRAWGASAPRSVRTYGARGDGRTDDTAAIQKAIDAGPGGEVVLPPGNYVAGTLRLRSRLVLRLAAGATLIASPDDGAFDPPERLPYESFADRETTDFSHALLQGREVQRVTILGPGRIDGNRRSRGGPKPIALKLCRDVVIRDLTIENAPNYNISLLGCEQVDIRGVTIRNGYADGIDPDCCRHVRIAGCRIESRDDAICLKASLALGARRATEYVVVTDCTLTNIRNGLKIGTESNGNIRNVVFRNCTLTGRKEFRGPIPLDVTPFPSAGVSIQNVDGGTLEHVVVTGIRMTDVRAPLFVRLGERGRGQPVPEGGTLAKITIADVVATGAEWTSSITGVPDHDVTEVALSDIRISAKGGGDAALVTRPVPERERDYPDAAHFRNLPAYGLYCRHVTGLRLDRITLAVGESDARPALVLDDVQGAAARAMVATAPRDGGPVAWLRSTRDSVLAIRSPAAPAVVRLSGKETARIRVEGAGQDPLAVLLDPDVDATALSTDGTVTRKAG